MDSEDINNDIPPLVGTERDMERQWHNGVEFGRYTERQAILAMITNIRPGGTSAEMRQRIADAVAASTGKDRRTICGDCGVAGLMTTVYPRIDPTDPTRIRSAFACNGCIQREGHPARRSFNAELDRLISGGARTDFMP